VRLTAKVKLETNKGSFSALEDTLREANRCCNWISDQAWNAKVFAQFKIHQLCYRTAREQFPRLASQVIIRCIAKVSDSYSLDKETKRTYRLNGAIAYDLRILRWYVDKGMVSIWTTSGRLKIPFVCGPRQKELLKSQQGESDLILRKKAFYLAASCNIDNPPPGMVDEFLGVDVGITNLAVDSDGNVYSGSAVKSIRHRHRSLRAKLQKKGTRAAKRLFLWLKALVEGSLLKTSRASETGLRLEKHREQSCILGPVTSCEHSLATKRSGKGCRSKLSIRVIPPVNAVSVDMSTNGTGRPEISSAVCSAEAASRQTGTLPL
jgi:hypothetical protein